MNVIKQDKLPKQLQEVPQVPEKLYIRGTLPPAETKLLCVVGSRKYSRYGRDACEKLISELAGYDIAVVSGLAFGIDSIAHRSALSAGLQTIAVPGSGLNPDVLYPAAHRGLAEDIIKNDGALVSEFEPDFRATTWSFPQRNRIMAGLSDATLVVEASERSGTLITARLALDYNRDVFVVPNTIFSESSKGSLNLLKQGAVPVLSGTDILNELGFNTENDMDNSTYENCSPNEKALLNELTEPREREELVVRLNLDISTISELLTLLEMKGLVGESMGRIHKRK